MRNGCSVGLFGRCERCDGHAASGSETDAGDQKRPAGPIDVVCLCFTHGSLRHCAARPIFVLTDVVWRARVSGMHPRCGGTIQMTLTDCEGRIGRGFGHHGQIKSEITRISIGLMVIPWSWLANCSPSAKDRE